MCKAVGSVPGIAMGGGGGDKRRKNTIVYIVRLVAYRRCCKMHIILI